MHITEASCVLSQPGTTSARSLWDLMDNTQHIVSVVIWRHRQEAHRRFPTWLQNHRCDIELNARWLYCAVVPDNTLSSTFRTYLFAISEPGSLTAFTAELAC